MGSCPHTQPTLHMGQGIMSIGLGPMGTHFTRILQSWLPFGRENFIYLNTQDLEALFGTAVVFSIMAQVSWSGDEVGKTGPRVNGFLLDA